MSDVHCAMSNVLVSMAKWAMVLVRKIEPFGTDVAIFAKDDLAIETSTLDWTAPHG